VYAYVQRSLVLPGASGAAAMGRVMAGFRERPPSAIAGRPVVAVSDYAQGQRTAEGRRTALGLPSANLLAFEVGEGARVLLRPSGTEPKLKLYVEAFERMGETGALEAVRARVAASAAALAESALELARARGLAGEATAQKA
jgi:phosphomannomutase